LSVDKNQHLNSGKGILMGVLSELVAASESEAQAVLESDGPSQNWPGIVCKGLDQIKFASLWVILSGETVRAEGIVQRLNQIEVIASAGEQGPWVLAIPEPFRDQLADLASEEDDALRKVATTWAASGELKGWQIDEVASLLQETADLADLAREDEKDLLLRVSL
jgi:hypothetical protein